MKKHTPIILLSLASVLCLAACPNPSAEDDEPLVYTAQSVDAGTTPWNTPALAYTSGSINYNTNVIHDGAIPTSSISFDGDNGIERYALCASPGTYWFKFSGFIQGYPDLEFYIATDFTVNGVTYHYKDYTDAYGVSISTRDLYDSDGSYLGALDPDFHPTPAISGLAIESFTDSAYWLKLVVTSVDQGKRIYVWANQERDRTE